MIAVEGGAVRSDSVRRALAAAGPGDPGEAVLVHDAARPLLTAELVGARACRARARTTSADAAIAAVPVTDTVKRVRGAGVVSETLERAELWAVQTPQVFRRAALERALDVPEEILAQATDDAWLVERAGGRVIVVRASEENLKVTTPLDLALAEMLLARRLRATPCILLESQAGPPRMLTDYHLHLRSDDLDATAAEHFTEANAERYRRAASERGIAELGVSEHVYRFEQALEVWRHPFWRRTRATISTSTARSCASRPTCGWASRRTSCPAPRTGWPACWRRATSIT